MPRVLTTACLFFLSLVAPAATVTVTPAERGGFAVITVSDVSPDASIDIEYDPQPVQLYEVSPTTVVIAGKPGTATKVTVDVVDFVKKTRKKERIMVPFLALTPDPKPTPPDPKPPVPAGDLRVLFLYESSKPLTEGQHELMVGVTLRKWLDANCVTENGLTGYRFWDKDTKIATDLPVWRDMLVESLKDATPVPKMVVFKGVKGTPYPWPASTEAALEVLKQYGK